MSLSLSETIRRSIAEPILAGEWKAGSRVPSEHDLMVRFQASRMTVHGVLATLAREGLITRRRGSGSFVAERSAAHAVLTITDIRDDIERVGHRHSMQVLGRDLANADVVAADLLQLSALEPVLGLTLLHLADEVPYQLEERLLVPSLLEETAAFSEAHVPYGGWLLKNVPWQEAEHTIRADAANRKIAAILGLKTGAPVLIVERRTFIHGRVLTWARLTHPASHRLVGRFSPPVL